MTIVEGVRELKGSSPVRNALSALRAARDPEQRMLREHHLNEVEYLLQLLQKREREESWVHPAIRERIAG